MSWISIASYLVLFLYCISLLAITIYCLMQFHLLFYYKKSKKIAVPPLDLSLPHLPIVTVQLPIYNERYVITRLVEAITQLDYPKSLLEIQILDDSTDDTVNIAESLTSKYQKQGFDIQHIRRNSREGFKAGALKSATAQTKGELIAIFDADFIPKKDFLINTLSYFNDSKVGVVQTRWEHLNQNYSLLTRIQAFQLNVHFTVEQKGRFQGNLLLQFNGTAGVWRKSTIADAGGWEADTLTEDLDLSYRAQLKGWRIIFLEDIVSPAELPSEMIGLKSQQYRWMKGGAETAKKVLPKIWNSELSFRNKLHASSHLLGSSVFIAVFMLGIMSVPLAFAIKPLGLNSSWMSFFMISFLTVSIVYYVANVQLAWKSESILSRIVKFILIFPVFLALSMGLSLHNAIAVFQGYIGRTTDFIRTPKFAIEGLNSKINNSSYFKREINNITIAEGLLCMYFVTALICSLMLKEYSFVALHILLSLGYGAIFFYTVRNSLK